MIDTHAHLQDEKIQNLDLVIKEAKEAGVEKIICAGCNLQTSTMAVELSEKYKEVYATVGFHPHDAEQLNEETLNSIKQLASNQKVVAIGEIGLDYYYMFASKEKQKEAFLRQIDLAFELKKPIVIHSREATGDVIDILRANLQKLKYGVCIHCFNMSLEILKEIVKYGFYISIGGIVTFKNANNVLTIAKECPSANLMLETDAPYLTPVPFRSKLNEPKYVVYSAQKIAELRGITLEELDEITTQNAIRFFGIKD